MTHMYYIRPTYGVGLDFVTTRRHTERWQEITKQIFETFLWPNMQSFNHRVSPKYTYKYEGQFGTGNKV